MTKNLDDKAVVIPTSNKGINGQKPKDGDGGKKAKKEKGEELSEQLQKLKEEIELLAERLKDPNVEIAKAALETLGSRLKSSTSTMTSVPPPLKFLRPHFPEIESYYNSLDETHVNRRVLSDILSILSTVIPNTDRKSLHFCLSGSGEAVTAWGHEYIRNITGELAEEYEARQSSMLKKMDNKEDTETKEFDVSDLLILVDQIVPFYIKHHNEIDAIDLLYEVEQIKKISDFVDSSNYQRVTEYLMALSDYAASDDEWAVILEVAYSIFLQRKLNCQAMRVALKLNNKEMIYKALISCDDVLVKRQIGYMLAQYQFNLQTIGIEVDGDNEQGPLISSTNIHLHEIYKQLAADLDVLEPKSPEEIYKSQNEDGRRGSHYYADANKLNLASIFVNAFVNVGFGTDTLITVDEGSWVFRNTSDYSTLSAAASMGAINLWNPDDGIQDVDKFRWAEDPMLKAGAALAIGVCCSNTRFPGDYAYGFLSLLMDCNTPERDAAILGLGIAYAGMQREELLSILVPLIIDTNLPFETSAFAAVSLALIFIGSANECVAESLLQTLIERQTTGERLAEPLSFLFGLSLGLLYLSCRDSCEAMIDALQAIESNPISCYVKTVLVGCAYAGTGDVTKIQCFLKNCIEQMTAMPSVSQSSSSSLSKPASKDDNSNNNGNSSNENNGNGAFEKSADAANSQTGEPSVSPETNDHQQPSTTDSSANNNNSTATAAECNSEVQPLPSLSATSIPSLAAVDNGNSNAAAAAAAAASATNQETSSAAAASSSMFREMSQAASVLSMVLVALGEPYGSSMQLRMIDHLLQYGSLPIRRAVPLALALLSTSNPKPIIVESLSKLSHDADLCVALSSIMSLGLIGSGTNNAKIADLLRHLGSSFYSSSANGLFCVRIAQGLLYMGKGLATLSPMISDGFLISPVSLACILIVLHCCLFMKQTLLGRFPYFLYFLFPAIRPRMLMTVDEAMNPISVTVRLGQAADTAGQAGKPRTLTGFQTFTTPVLLSAGERAELATSDYVMVSQTPLEGIVILRKAAEGGARVDSE